MNKVITWTVFSAAMLTTLGLSILPQYGRAQPRLPASANNLEERLYQNLKDRFDHGSALEVADFSEILGSPEQGMFVCRHVKFFRDNERRFFWENNLWREYYILGTEVATAEISQGGQRLTLTFQEISVQGDARRPSGATLGGVPIYREARFNVNAQLRISLHEGVYGLEVVSAPTPNRESRGGRTVIARKEKSGMLLVRVHNYEWEGEEEGNRSETYYGCESLGAPVL